MKIAQEVDAAVDLMVPGVGWAKLAARAVLVLVAIAIAGFIIWQVFIAGRAAQQKHDVAESHGQAVVGKAQGQAGGAAANIVANGAAKETIIREKTRTNYVEITKQPGAGDRVSDAVDAAGRRAICLRASAAGLPDCQRLQETRP